MGASFVIALRAKRLQRPGIADTVGRLPPPANLRAPPWTFVFSYENAVSCARRSVMARLVRIGVKKELFVALSSGPGLSGQSLSAPAATDGPDKPALALTPSSF